MIVKMHFTHAMHVCRNMTDADYKELSSIHWCGEANDFADAMAVEMENAPGWKYALLKDDEPICVGGLHPLSPGVTNVWGIATNRVTEVVEEYTLFARKMIRNGLNLPEVHRVQAVTACSHKQAHRWLEAIGLTRESEIPMFGRRGENYFMYGRTS